MTVPMFDFVIVGGGSAGCVLANRLSANPATRVLLVEAGRDTPPGQVPDAVDDSYPMALFHNDTYIWPRLLVRINQGSDGGVRKRVYEQGRIMGGGSSVNVQAANRGLPRDYDEWSSLGAEGWAWKDVLPYFRKLERDLDFDNELHGQQGPIPIRRIAQKDFPPFATATLRAWSRSGLTFRPDQNGDIEDGLFPPAFSNERDSRVSTAVGYLDAQTRKRPNLTIWSDTKVLRLLVSGKRATGVEVDHAGTTAQVQAGNVVLAAGALQTPAMLMRAGIGPGRALQELGISVAHDLPGVGQNLRDHPALTICQYLPPALRLSMSYRRPSFVAMRYSSNQAGGSPSDMYMTASARAGWHALGQRLALYFMWCNRPYSFGQVSLVTPHASDYPNVDLNLLSDTRDVVRLMDGVRRLTALVIGPDINANPDDLFPAALTPRIKRYSAYSPTNAVINRLLGGVLDVPASLRRLLLRTFMTSGLSLVSMLKDEQRLEDFVRDNVFGVWHASGTCRMGRAGDPMAVVDASGKIRGMENIFVADASIMPRLPTANTNIPVIMIAEKIAAGLTGAAPA